MRYYIYFSSRKNELFSVDDEIHDKLSCEKGNKWVDVQGTILDEQVFSASCEAKGKS